MREGGKYLVSTPFDIFKVIDVLWNGRMCCSCAVL